MTQIDKNNVKPLSHYVHHCLDEYFTGLNGSTPPCGLYKMVLEQTEKPLLENVLKYSAGNQSRAAELLGINRGTLRKKLKQYQLDV